ncbi:MAG: Lrp/AsnC ligand binding domain-containing protein [Nitrosopumilus sp.]|nr:Lrp/AsnC ligand binding domain-containing protein [Nitrosopumilus sp.]
MSLGFVLLQCDEGNENKVLKKLGQIKGVKETHETHGLYNAVVKIETNSHKQLKQICNEKIRVLSGVRSTLTLIEDFQ